MTIIQLCECGCGQPAPLAKLTDRRFNKVKGQPQRFINGHQRRHFPPLVERFYAKVDKRAGDNACWMWLGSRDKNGYGEFRVEGRVCKAHRVAWELAHDKPLDSTAPSTVIRHSCDNPPCCNPAHLSAGTHIDNIHDKIERGRQNPPVGERGGLSKLTWEQVREVRRLYATGDYTLRQLAEQFGVTISPIHNIVRNRTWVEHG